MTLLGFLLVLGGIYLACRCLALQRGAWPLGLGYYLQAYVALGCLLSGCLMVLAVFLAVL